MLLPIVAGVIGTLQVNEAKMRAALDDAMLATDLADHLVRRGIPFREAHGLVGQAVLLSEQRDVPLAKLSLQEYGRTSPAFDPDVLMVFDFRASVEARDVPGGTALSAVKAQIAKARRILTD